MDNAKMENFVCFLCLVIILFFNFINSQTLDNSPSRRTEKFILQPRGTNLTFEHEWDGTKCVFSYNCVGGTNEEWEMTFSRTENSDLYTCSVQRRPSYLYFNSFTLTYTSKLRMAYSSASAFFNDKSITDQCIIDSNKLEVSSGSKFKSELTKVSMNMSTGRKNAEEKRQKKFKEAKTEAKKKTDGDKQKRKKEKEEAKKAKEEKKQKKGQKKEQKKGQKKGQNKPEL